MPQFEHKFKVVGKGAFAIDMLRFDSCFPQTAKDSATIQASMRGRAEAERSVWLVTVSHNKAWRPATDRWRAHGWTVQEHTVVLKEGPFLGTPHPPSTAPRSPVRKPDSSSGRTDA